MRTSLHEIKEIEDFLFENGEHQDQFLTQTKVVIYPEFAEKVKLQSEVYSFIHLHGQSQLRKEIQSIEKELFTPAKNNSFLNRINKIFNK